jgi:hypothetical protein
LAFSQATPRRGGQPIQVARADGQTLAPPIKIIKVRRKE